MSLASFLRSAQSPGVPPVPRADPRRAGERELPPLGQEHPTQRRGRQSGRGALRDAHGLILSKERRNFCTFKISNNLFVAEMP